MDADWQRYLQKALESLDSARISLSQQPRMCNCAANRAYYAAYLAELAALQKLDPLKSSGDGWRHLTVVKAFNFRLIKKSKTFGRSFLQDVSYLQAQRVTADYKAEDVSDSDAVECYRRAAEIVDAVRRELEK